jgi:hypothetical protein
LEAKYEGECVMWQKEKGKLHLLLNHSSAVLDGRFFQTACGELVQSRKDKQKLFPDHIADCCVVCTGVWRLTFTSVDDAKGTLRLTTNLTVLRRSLEITTSVTLKKMLQARIHKLEKVGVK